MKLSFPEYIVSEKENTSRFYNEIFSQKIYALDTVIDIGGNLGIFSHYISPFANTIFTVEPHRESFECLARSVKENSLEEVIFPFNLAISGENGNRKLTGSEDGGFSLSSEMGEVECLTLFSFIKKIGVDHVDLMKIDVEGGESEIFQALDIDQALKYISTIVGEGHGLGVMKPVLERNGFEVTERKGNFIAKKI